MKIEKKDLPKVLLLIGVFIIGLGLFFSFSNTNNKRSKKDWKDQVDGYQPEEPSEVIDDYSGIEESIEESNE